MQLTRLCALLLSLPIALSVVMPAVAQQGQYYASYVRFTLPGMKSRGVLATYSPIVAIDGQTIQLRSDDGSRFTFTLDADTVYCQGEIKVSDWAFLKNMGKKTSVTVMTNDDTDKKALVVWDRGPSLSMQKGAIIFDFPPMCK
ncbi:MAG: hypothetical protein ABSE51_03900 [Terracidiphilus sp.]|jgi:hypothetical protein